MPRINVEQNLDGYPENQTAVGKALDRVVTDYEVKVFTIAMHLTGSEEAARQVTENVFVRLNREWKQLGGENLDQVIHRLAYDEALPILLAQIAGKAEEQDDAISKLLYGHNHPC